jgi:predicted  nucleic acid-binding Zn-ribbon protein
VLIRAQEANALTRRLRGLPHPDQQRQALESLRARRARLEEARTQAAEQLAALNIEFQEAEQTIADYGHLPDPSAAAQEARTLRAEERRLNDEFVAASSELSEAEREIAELGAPLERFRSEHDGQVSHEVLRRVAELAVALEPIAAELTRLRQQIQTVQEVLEESLVARSRQLHAWSIADHLPDGYAALADLFERSIGIAREELAGQSTETLHGERDQVRTRLREIEARLAEIAEALEQVEKLVIAEASVVATTLTRAYKRESVQARTFDTVILDEASMAPIPALWVVAARAEKSVVLVGDFMQLPPIKHSAHELAEEWLGRDIFDKAGVRELFDDETRRPAHCVPLREQRRMHPDISAICNRFVYSGKLRDGQGLGDAELLNGWFKHAEPFDNPVLLVDTSKLDAWVTSVNLGGRSSRLNFLSATVSADIALMLLRDDREPFQPGRTPRILLCAPYRPHAKLLSLLAKAQTPVGEVVAGTAHTFQGAEAPVVIFDLVNDEPHWRVGMFSERMEEDTKRLLNVALTRPQRRLIVVGDFRWIEQKAKKDGILRRLIAYLKEHHTIVDARELLLAGFAARAAAIQQSGAAERDQPLAPQLVVAQDRFFEHLHEDLAGASERVVIYSPFITQERVGRLEPHLRAAVERGAEVWVITKTLEERSADPAVYLEIEQGLRNWGVRLIHKKGMHEKLVMIDYQVLWQGSLNPLSFSATQEIMERRVSREIVADYARVLRLGDLLSAYRANETDCPYCGGEVVAAEGPNEPFYWRCVEDGCFTRSIGDPMPVDGRVVCHSCGGQLEFRWPSADPFWRCTENHRHRQPVARTHLRLPKMLELIPKAELRKLERRFNVRAAAPADADGQLRLR